MHALPIMVVTLCTLAIGYRYYSAFIASKVLALDPTRVTPAHRFSDGKDFVPTNRWVLFGHHFAAITGAGPLIGPVLAAQFGFLPGLSWILIGVTLGGGVHDFVILTASVRRGGQSLAEIAREEIGPVAGVIAAIAIFFTVIIAIAAMGFAVINILAESAWATFTIGMTIPIALVMGAAMRGKGHSAVRNATLLGVLALFLAVWGGRGVAASALGPYLKLDHNTLIYAICVYGFVASVLPVWLLLVPRDYLSAYMKLGTLAVLVVGIMIVNPELKMDMFTEFVHGKGPIIPGKVFPFVFITIACGAISGFHSLIASGTTPKMLDNERDARFIGYGAMLCEGLVGVTSLIAAASLYKADYFAINVSPAKFAKLGMTPVDLQSMMDAIGEDLRGRTAGSVSLAVGIAKIFSGLPGMKTLLAYWYHFIVMFEAVFILTTVDAGTRVARFLAQEVLGRFEPRFRRHDWAPGTVIASILVVVAWGAFLRTGSISTLWPMLGIANQLLATTALCVGTTVIVNAGRARYAWVTLVPLAFVATTTLSAAYLSTVNNFLKLGNFQGWLDAGLSISLMFCTVAVLAASVRKWWLVTTGRSASVPLAGPR
ncbi:MAG: carbon starvation protein CstA [Myxococcales bacterium]|nr:carbon starvation protein CstA [Myxococcales bacterium]